MNRIFFTTSIFLALMFSQQISHAQFPDFKYYTIGESDELSGQTSLADIDNDGDPDWIVGSIYTVYWFEYIAPDHWERHVIGENPLTEAGGTAMDVDGDGWIDQVSGGTWFKNTGDPTKPFEPFENKAIMAQENVQADVNGDGHPDIVAMNDIDGLYWYDFSSKPEKKWKSNYIGEGVRSGISPHGVADLDEDGDVDIVRSNEWFENMGEGKEWVKHPNLKLTRLEEPFPNSTRSWIIDMNKDGRADIVQIESYLPDCKVVWLEKMDQKGRTWYMHKIAMNTEQELQSLIVADFDNDGDLDVFAGGASRSKANHKKCFIWENISGDGTEWKEHVILTDHGSFEAAAADIDNDGDIDICSKPWQGKENYYLRNMLMENKK